MRKMCVSVQQAAGDAHDNYHRRKPKAKSQCYMILTHAGLQLKEQRLRTMHAGPPGSESPPTEMGRRKVYFPQPKRRT